MPKKQKGKLRVLGQVIEALRTAINAKRRNQIRFLFARADALVKALPRDLTTEQREQLTRLRKKSAAAGKSPTRDAQKPTPTSGAGFSGKKPTTKRASKSRQKPKPQSVPARELGDRIINRASFGYGPADES